MDFEQIVAHLEKVGAPGILEVCTADVVVRPTDPAEAKKFKYPAGVRTGESFLLVDPAQVVAFAEVLRDDPDLHFEMLVDETAADPGIEEDELWVVYQFLSVVAKHRLSVKCSIPKAEPQIPSLSAIYPSANWHEREAGEMFGINFKGHPDPRNMLLPDDWVGYPLRKDYQYPEEYHGISCL